MAHQRQDSIHGKIVKITYDNKTKVFEARLEDGTMIGTGPDGRALGSRVWKDGAGEVQYRYDLALDER
jgi:hypothetical protein